MASFVEIGPRGECGEIDAELGLPEADQLLAVSGALTQTLRVVIRWIRRRRCREEVRLDLPRGRDEQVVLGDRDGPWECQLYEESRLSNGHALRDSAIRMSAHPPYAPHSVCEKPSLLGIH